MKERGAFNNNNYWFVVPAEEADQLNQLTKQLKELFREECELNANLYDIEDINRLRESDFFVRRFLYPAKKDLQVAFDMLKNAMQWRKDMGFKEASDIRFPMEFYKIGALFPYEPDRDGSPVIYMRFQVYKKLDELVDPIRKFLIYNMDKLDRQVAYERGWGVIFDCRDAGLSNVDFDMLIYLIKTVRNYFCWGLKYIVVYDLPWLLTPAWKIALAMMPEEARKLFRLYNSKTIDELFDRDNLPDFMDGTCTRDYKKVPVGAKSAEEVALVELNMNADQVMKIKKHFEKYLPDDGIIATDL